MELLLPGAPFPHCPFRCLGTLWGSAEIGKESHNHTYCEESVHLCVHSSVQ